MWLIRVHHNVKAKSSKSPSRQKSSKAKHLRINVCQSSTRQEKKQQPRRTYAVLVEIEPRQFGAGRQRKFAVEELSSARHVEEFDTEILMI